MNSEMILTCLSAFAQAESESIRSNITKGIRMGYRQGRFSFRYVNFLGYRKGADGQPEIHLEEALHHAILEAIRSLIQNRQKDMAANLENALLDSLSDNLDELSPEAVKNKLKKLKQEFDQLLIMAGEGNEIADRTLEQIGKEMRKLKENSKELEPSEERRNAAEEKHRKIRELISSENLSLKEYFEALVYRMIERIMVLSKEQIQICFAGGYEMTQSLLFFLRNLEICSIIT